MTGTTGSSGVGELIRRAAERASRGEFDEEMASTFFDLLFPGQNEESASFAQIAALPLGGKIVVDLVKSKPAFLDFCRKWNGKAQVYVGVHPVARNSGGRPKGADVISARVVPFDIEVDHPRGTSVPADVVEITYRLAAVEVAYLRRRYGIESLVVMSQNGWHLYAFFDRAIPAAEMPSLQDRLHGLTDEVMQDPGVAAVAKAINASQDKVSDLARIMKVPGTIGIKGEIKRLCTIYGAVPGTGSARLRERIERGEFQPAGVEVIVKLDPKVQAVLDTHPKYLELFQGRWKGKYKSRSEADAALGTYLASHGFDRDQVAAVLSVSEIGKWAVSGDSYRKHTLDFVMKSGEDLRKKRQEAAKLTAKPEHADVAKLEEVYGHLGKLVRVIGRIRSVSPAFAAEVDDEGTTLGHRPVVVMRLEDMSVGQSGLAQNVSVEIDQDPGKSDLPWGEVEVIARVEVGEKKNRRLAPARLRAQSIHELGTTALKYRPTPEDEALINKHFAGLTIDQVRPALDATIAPSVVGRSFEKMLAMLTMLTPYKLPWENGREFLLTTMFCGDPGEGKDAILRDLFQQLAPPGAVSINAEVSRRTGLVAAAEKDPETGDWILRWGLLVEADRTAAHLSGLSSFEPQAISQLREVLSTRMAEVNMIVRGKRPARARLLITANPRQACNLYPNRLAAARDIGCRDGVLFAESPDWRRVHLVAVFAKEDVPSSARDEALTSPNVRAIPADAAAKLIADTWRREFEDYDWASLVPLRAAILAKLADLRKSYPDIDLALLGPEGVHILSSMIVACATLRHRTDEKGRIRTDRDDLDLACNVIDEMVERLGLDRAQRISEDEEFVAKRFCERLHELEGAEGMEDAAKAYFDALTTLHDKGAMSSEMLAHAIGISRRSWFRYRSRLEGPDTGLGYLLGPRELFQARTGDGIELTLFGRLVGQALRANAKPPAARQIIPQSNSAIGAVSADGAKPSGFSDPTGTIGTLAPDPEAGRAPREGEP